MLISVASFLLLLTSCSSSDNSALTGRYLKTNESHMLIDEHGGPIVMRTESDKEYLFKDLQNGDKINITCGAILESYPAQCTIYSLKLIATGTIENIPKSTLDSLKEMGWIDNY
ncbi:MAG: hypothetical protein RR192_02240 [Peptostreptococcaceae bacterium]